MGWKKAAGPGGALAASALGGQRGACVQARGEGIEQLSTGAARSALAVSVAVCTRRFGKGARVSGEICSRVGAPLGHSLLAVSLARSRGGLITQQQSCCARWAGGVVAFRVNGGCAGKCVQIEGLGGGWTRRQAWRPRTGDTQASRTIEVGTLTGCGVGRGVCPGWRLEAGHPATRREAKGGGGRYCKKTRDLWWAEQEP